jgi:hypothetical protein
VSTKTIGIALASIMALVLVVAGYFVFSKSGSEPETVASAATPAPVTNAPPAVEAAPAPAPVAAERAAAPIASTAAINPPPVPPVEAVTPAPVQPPPPANPAPAAVVATAPVVPTPAPAPAANSKPVAPAIATGTVHFELKDGWGMVYVDGQSKGTSPPLVNLKLPPGAHEIELRNPAMATVKRSVEVVAGKTVVFRHAFTK